MRIKRQLRVVEEPLLRHIKSTIHELNRVIGFKPSIRVTGDKKQLESNLRAVAVEIDINDAFLLSPVANWTLMHLSVGDWKFAKFVNPFYLENKGEVDAYVRMNLIRNKKWGAVEVTKEHPLSMQHWNPFIESPAVTNEIVFQYMSDPSQSSGEVARKFRERGYKVRDEYVKNIVNVCKKAIRFGQLYQGSSFGTRKRSDMGDEEKAYKNRKIYNAMHGIWDVE